MMKIPFSLSMHFIFLNNMLNVLFKQVDSIIQSLLGRHKLIHIANLD